MWRSGRQAGRDAHGNGQAIERGAEFGGTQREGVGGRVQLSVLLDGPQLVEGGGEGIGLEEGGVMVSPLGVARPSG
ncbi:hypothetical protein [Deinococcus sp. QL22]|uniref:hypothetical protein n=1 Tax=Deinococcus sp. QL22 TaxID=2939437 RepID=UPI0020171E2D|nr:hypothetical protein [Deinococcus sp. QL22]UQN08520.1 hypothetical protein M1R55_17600 [Deinococcus sp. QL22]